MKFALIGDGRQAQIHKEAIRNVGGEVISVFDPKYGNTNLRPDYLVGADYAVICSPSHCHKRQIDFCRRHDTKVIVEKPYCLPHERIDDDDEVFICLQLRWLVNLPKRARWVKVAFSRDKEWFDSWKGDYFKTGGVFYSLFIHYIDLAMKLKAGFEGMVGGGSVPNYRRIGKTDILESTKSKFLYTYMYYDILEGNGVRPRDIKHLHLTLNALSLKYGYGSETVGKTIKISAKELKS